MTPDRIVVPGRRFTAPVFGMVVGVSARGAPVAVVPSVAVVGCGTFAPFKPRVVLTGGTGTVLPGILAVPPGVRPGVPPIGLCRLRGVDNTGEPVLLIPGPLPTRTGLDGAFGAATPEVVVPPAAPVVP
jgi:hypothetical protein